jgi:hypothetical protein
MIRGHVIWEVPKKVRKVIFLGTYVFLLLFLLWHLIPLINPMGPVYSDVAKRIRSPDYSKAAILVRRSGFDLNFIIKVKEKGIARTLHVSRDFVPDLTADWNEEIVWSDDSSMLVFRVDDIQNDGAEYMWAYDFMNRREYFDKGEIVEIFNSRNEKSGDI